MLQNVAWGEKVLSIAHEVLQQFGDDIKLYAFKTTPRGYIYIRLDQLSHEYVFSLCSMTFSPSCFVPFVNVFAKFFFFFYRCHFFRLKKVLLC